MNSVNISVDRDYAVRLAILVDGQIRSVDEQIADKLEEGGDNPQMIKMRLDSLYRDKLALEGLVASIRQAIRWFDGPD